MRAAARYAKRTYSVETELVFVALVLLAWHAIRIPIEGDVATSLAHADDVLGLERALSLDVEHAVIGRLDDANVTPALAWLYTNIHLPVLFAFVAAARLLAPDSLPGRPHDVRAGVPARGARHLALSACAATLACREFGFGAPPTDAELTNTTGALFHNTTAAAASQHFGFSVLVAATAIWLFPRSRLAYATLVYPVVVFLVIVGTGNHYVVDCIIGTLTFVLAAAVATIVHRPRDLATAGPQTSGVASIALGYGLITWGFVSLDLTGLRSWDNAFYALVLVGGVAAVIAPRLAEKEPLTESR